MPGSLVWLAGVICPGGASLPVWITLTATLAIEPGASMRRARYGEATLADTQVGRLSVPGWLLTLMLGSHEPPRCSAGQVPAVVERVDIGDGKLTIKTR